MELSLYGSYLDSEWEDNSRQLLEWKIYIHVVIESAKSLQWERTSVCSTRPSCRFGIATGNAVIIKFPPGPRQLKHYNVLGID